MLDTSIRVLCYAHVQLPADFFAGVPLHSGEGIVQGAMLYTLLSQQDGNGTEHHFLVDAGFRDERWLERFSFSDFEPAETMLAKVGVSVDQIEALLLTHMHFDHVNGASAFPNATVYVPWAEYSGWVNALTLPPSHTPSGEESWLTASFDRRDPERLSRLAAEGRLRFLRDGDTAIPGVHSNVTEEGHTFGNQWLVVDTSSGPYVVAGDAVMWYSNIEEMWPSGTTAGNTYRMLLTYGRITDRLEGDTNRLVPGHDMEVFSRHRSWTSGANEIAELHVADWDTSRRPG